MSLEKIWEKDKQSLSIADEEEEKRLREIYTMGYNQGIFTSLAILTEGMKIITSQIAEIKGHE